MLKVVCLLEHTNADNYTDTNLVAIYEEMSELPYNAKV